MSLMQLANTAVRASIVGLLTLALSASVHEKRQRSVAGRVTDGSGTVIEGAVVQLKHLETLDVRSYITQTDGMYTFHGLQFGVDYELKAGYKGEWSRSRNLSGFNSRSNARIDLTIPAARRHEERRETEGTVPSDGVRKIGEVAAVRWPAR